MHSLFDNSFFLALMLAWAWVGNSHADTPKELIATLGSHRFQQNCEISNLAFSSDGTRIIAFGNEQTVVWDAQNGKRLFFFKAANSVAGVTSKNGERIVLTTNDGSISVVETNSARSNWKTSTDSGRFGVAISDDGKKIAINKKEANKIAIHNNLGRLLHEIECDESGIRSPQFSPKGKRLVCAEKQSGRNLIYSLDGSPPLVLEGGQAPSSSTFDFSFDGKLLAGMSQIKKGNSTGSYLRIWDSRTGKVVGTQRGSFNSIRFSPDSRVVAASDYYGVSIFDLETGDKVQVMGEKAPRISSIAFSPDGEFLATTQNSRIRIWNTKTWKEVNPGEGHDARTHLVEFSPDGQTIATASRDESVIVWDWPAAKPRFRIEKLGQSSYGPGSLSISSDSKQLLIAGWNINEKQPFFVYDLKHGTRISKFGFERPSGPCIFLPNGKQAVSPAGKDGSIAIWEISSGKQLRTIGSTPKGSIVDIRPIQNRNAVWWAGENQQCGIRDLETGTDSQHLDEMSHHSSAKITLSPDNNWLAIDGQVKDLKTGEFLLRDQEPVNAISPDGQLLVIGRSIWEKSTQKFIHTFGEQVENSEVHTIEAVTFSPDGTILLMTGDPDTTVWDMTGLLSEEKRTLPKLELANDELEKLWKSLIDDDGWKAQQAAWRFAAGGESSVKFLFDKIQPAKPPTASTIKRLRDQLTSEDLAARTLAARQLSGLGIALKPDELNSLRRIRPDAIPPANASSVPDAIEKGYPRESFLTAVPKLLPLPNRVRETRAIGALQRSPNPAAKTILAALANGHPESPLTIEARSALARVQNK